MGELISDALNNIMNAERVSKKECRIKHTSKFLAKILDILIKNGYIKGYEVIKESAGNSFIIKLHNRINKIGAIRPRYPCTLTEIEGFEKRYLPAVGFGIIIISTPKGLMTHVEAKNKKIGGTLIAYCY